MNANVVHDEGHPVNWSQTTYVVTRCVLYAVSLGFGSGAMLLMWHWGFTWKQIALVSFIDCVAYSFLQTYRAVKRERSALVTPTAK